MLTTCTSALKTQSEVFTIRLNVMLGNMVKLVAPNIITLMIYTFGMVMDAVVK
jgi:hypothetical protein